MMFAVTARRCCAVKQHFKKKTFTKQALEACYIIQSTKYAARRFGRAVGALFSCQNKTAYIILRHQDK